MEKSCETKKRGKKKKAYECFKKYPTLECPAVSSSQRSSKPVINNTLTSQLMTITLNALSLFPKLSLWHSGAPICWIRGHEC